MKHRMLVKIMWLGLLLAAVLVSGCGSLGASSTQGVDTTPLPTVVASQGVLVEGRIVPLDDASLSFSSGGDILEILVTEGQFVQAGQVLMRLDQREPVEAAVTSARLELVSAQQDLDDLNEKADMAYRQALKDLAVAEKAVIEARKALDDLDTADFREELDDAEIEVQDAKDDLDDAQEEADKYQDLDPDNQTRKNAEDELEEAQQAYDDAVYERDLLRNQLTQAQALLDLTITQQDDIQRRVDRRKDGPDPDELALAQARLDNAQAQLAAAEKALTDIEIVAPYAGTVVEIDVSENEPVRPGQVALTFADTSAWFVETKDLNEMDVVDLAMGQRAVVVPDALPDVSLAGTVESISDAYKERSGDVLYTVRIKLHEWDSRLRWGMTVAVEFEE